LNAELTRAKEFLETQVRARTAELARTNDQLEELVYTIAHDLRAPLRAMQAFATLLESDYGRQLDKTAHAYCSRIVRATNSMDTMIRDLLAYGRVSRGNMALTRVNVQAAWDHAIFQNEQAIHEKRAQVETSPPLPEVIAHEGTLAQIFANLLSNSLKFVAPGVSPKVKLWAEERDAGFVRFNLRDNGVGIPSQHLNRIFRVFERLDGDRYPGTGIGLSIVRKGIERMGGRVGVESMPEQGSRFWIELRKAS
jgi:signal transduction histidine kinase